MNTYRKLAIATAISGALTVFSTGARAQLLEQKITVNFSAPVEVPGAILLPGTYVFEAVQDGKLTRILSPDESHVYAALLTAPEERLQPVDKATVTLEENPTAGSPKRVESWFFPGEATGNEFLYQNNHSWKLFAPITDAAKGVEHSSEFIGEHAAHLAAKVGKAIV